MKKFETMNTQRKVNKMLFSKERVELNIVDDLDKLNTTYYTSIDTATSRIKGLLSEARATETKLDEAIKATDKMQPIVSNVKKMAQELGVNPNNISELGDAELAISRASEWKQVLATIKKFISSI